MSLDSTTTEWSWKYDKIGDFCALIGDRIFRFRWNWHVNIDDGSTVACQIWPWSVPRQLQVCCFGPIWVAVFTIHGEIWHGSVLLVHCLMPNIALIWEGVGTGAPHLKIWFKKLFFCGFFTCMADSRYRSTWNLEWKLATCMPISGWAVAGHLPGLAVVAMLTVSSYILEVIHSILWISWMWEVYHKCCHRVTAGHFQWSHCVDFHFLIVNEVNVCAALATLLMSVVVWWRYALDWVFSSFGTVITCSNIVEL